MKSIFYGLLMIGMLPTLSLGDGYGDRPYAAQENSGVTLMANNSYSQEVDVATVPFAKDFTVSNILQAIPRDAAWDWVQFSVRFNEGDRTITTACSAYGEGQDAASYDMMIPTHQLPQTMRVLIRTHDFGGTPSYDCAVYPNLPYHFFRPRH